MCKNCVTCTLDSHQPPAEATPESSLGVRITAAATLPVVSLAHDVESREIAPSFTAFLTAWERLCYLNPEIWLLEPFLDPATGHLDADSEPARKLREAFNLR